MKTRSRDAVLGLAATTLVLTGLVGCSDDSDPGADPTPSADSPSETETDTEPTDEPTEPAVEPATGPSIRSSVATVRAPARWTTKNTPFGSDAAREPTGEVALEKDVYGFLDLEVIEAEGTPTLDEAAREAASYATTEGTRVEDSELGGEPAFVFTSNVAGFGSTEHTIGLARDGSYVWLSFSLLGSDRGERQDLIDSVLASWQWRP